MSDAWLTLPVVFTGSRKFSCKKKTPAECAYYKQRWHFWHESDHVFAIPTVILFTSIIGLFVIGYIISILFLRKRKIRPRSIWQRGLAGLRYLSYRGYHVRRFRWNSAPVGVLMLGAIGTVYFFCMDLGPKPYYWVSRNFGGSPPLATRSAWLALACMPFVFATASKTNWITLLTGVSYERLQVFHRWIAYAFFVLALLHTFPYFVYHVYWHDLKKHFTDALLYYWTGIIALTCQAWLTFFSHATIRNLGYEFFKAMHLFAVVVFILTFFLHCDHALTSWHYFVATAAVYVPCFVYPWLRSAFEYKWTQKAHIAVEENGFTRVTIPAHFHWIQGQHCFLRFTGFGILPALSAHPFTICSSPQRSSDEASELVFYIRPQGGFTAKLYQHALLKSDVPIPVVVDGPYGGVNPSRLRDADRLLVIAGGSGAGWCLPLIEHFARSASTSSDEEQGNGELAEKSAPRGQKNYTSLRVVVATRDTKSRLWFERTVAELLAKFATPDLSSSVHIQIYLTGGATQLPDLSTSPASPSHSAASTSSDEIIVETGKGVDLAAAVVPSKEFEGRPPLPQIVQEEATQAAEAGESLSVYVCGPEIMQNDVRNAVAAENLKILSGSQSGGVYLHSEHFSWA
ncbi:putative ferric reductase [Pyrenophora teres f. maculata]|nr:putative ferric reductase [Pyrenophora teres f. maculata]